MTTVDTSVGVVELHHRLVSTSSRSGDEAAAIDLLAGVLAGAGAGVERLGRNLVARTGTGAGPRLLFNSHVDTVPPADGWTRAPLPAQRDGDLVYGLGSNDAKASVAAMTTAFLDVHRTQPACELILTLVVDEETGGEGTEVVWPALRERGWIPDGVVVGEPTGLEIAIAQKGLLVLELIAEGDACHSANAHALDARNAAVTLARDLVALADLDLGPAHPELGPSTLQPTIVTAGSARNMVPGRASAFLDLRTVPGPGHDALIDRVRSAVTGTVRVVSKRLGPVGCPPDATIVTAARRARPAARCFGSRTMSDLVFFDGVPAIKCGPGESERSHRPDEFVRVSELEDGARFYRALVDTFAECAGSPSESSP